MLALAVHLIAYISLFTRVFWPLLYIDLCLCIFLPNCTLQGVTVPVLLQLEGLSSCSLPVLA